MALPPNPDPAIARDEIREVLDLLRGQPGVAYASLIDEQEIGSLVQPWLDLEAAELERLVVRRALRSCCRA